MKTDEEKIKGWNEYFKNTYKLPDKLELIDKTKKGNPYMKFVLIFLGMCLVAIALAYNGYMGHYKSDISCNENLTCGDNVCSEIPSCPTCPTNNCNPSFTCDVPDEIKIRLNETG